MALLCLKICRGNLDLPDNTESVFYVTVKVENLKATSLEKSGKRPQWDQELCFEVSNKADSNILMLELWEKGFLWDKMLGTTCILFKEIPPSIDEMEPKWVTVYQELRRAAGTGSLTGHGPTCHELLVDVRFETGADLTLEEILLIQSNFESDWRFDGFDGIEFDHCDEHECAPSDDECQTSIEEKAECDQHVEIGSETESRLSDSRRSPKRQYSNPKSDDAKLPLFTDSVVEETTPIANAPSIEHRIPSPLGSLSETPSQTPTRRTTQLSFVRDSISVIDLDDQNFSVAKFRWIQAVNKIRIRLRESGDEADIAKVRKSGWGAQAIASNFLSSIDSMPNFKLTRKNSIPLMQELTAELMNRQKTGITTALLHSRATFHDNELKQLVYKKALQSLVYPISNTTPHNFEVYTAPRPVYCEECRGFLWGVARQGMRCSECRLICHEKCQDLINADCLQRAAERSSKKESLGEQTQRIISVMNKSMEARVESSPEVFNILRQVFAINEDDHRRSLNAARQSILDGTSQWRAKLSITVHQAQGLAPKDKTGTSDPYVSVQIGNVRKRTKTMHKNLNPLWDEQFQFDCSNSTDRIKVRVWDEDNDIKSKVKSKLFRESDDFLGQTIIEVRTLSGDNELWYNLEKRSEKSLVSGTIKLTINCEIKGEEKVAPYHLQYNALHESLFIYICSVNEDVPKLPEPDGNEVKRFFEIPEHEIVSEFAVRYGIEPIYAEMVHFSCLATKYMLPGVPWYMTRILEKIIKFYTSDSFTQISPCRRFASSNFGSSRFKSILDQLHNSLRIDLSSYRENFPASNKQRLHDLSSIVGLLNQISNFKSNVLQLLNQVPTKDVIAECVRASVAGSYNYIFSNCHELFSRELGDENKWDPVEQGPTSLKSLDFWTKLITLCGFIIEEDKTVYSNSMNVLEGFSIFEISAIELWKLYVDDLRRAMEEHAEHKHCSTTDYMNLQFKVKWLFKEYVLSLPAYGDSPPEYPALFQSFTLDWLEENETISMKFLTGAYERDKKESFATSTDMALFSCSVVDIFTQMNQSFEVIRKLDCPNPDVRGCYMQRFSRTIDNVLMEYVRLIQNDFREICSDEEKACILMNNVQQSRVQLEKMYEMMGGEHLVPSAQDILKDLQNKHSTKLDELSILFGESFLPRINEGVKQMGIMLYEVKGQEAPATDPEVMVETDNILSPVLSTLDDSFELFSQSAEKTVLKRILKSLWKILLNIIEKEVVLPSTSGNMLINAGKSAIELGRKFGSNLKTSALAGTFTGGLTGSLSGAASAVQGGNLLNVTAEKALTPRHCSIMECAIENLKIYFHSDNMGLKKSFLSKSNDLKSLQYALSLYTLSTDNLIKRFIETQKDIPKEVESYGEVNLQMDLRQTNQQMTLTVQIVSAQNLTWKQAFKPYIELNILGPGLKPFKRQFTTKSKKNQWSPKFNETANFTLPGNEGAGNFELHLSCKDWWVMGVDKLVGSTSINLGAILNKGSCAVWATLVKREKFDDTGCTILRILSQRVTDDLAKEFVRFKTQQREVNS